MAINKIIDAVMGTAQDLHKAGVMDEVILRDFDALTLPLIEELSAIQIHRIRKANRASQPVFAAYRNTSVSIVKQWAQGKKHPCGTSMEKVSPNP